MLYQSVVSGSVRSGVPLILLSELVGQPIVCSVGKSPPVSDRLSLCEAICGLGVWKAPQVQYRSTRPQPVRMRDDDVTFDL